MLLNSEFYRLRISVNKIVLFVFFLTIVFSAFISKLFSASSMAFGLYSITSLILVLYIIKPKKIEISLKNLFITIFSLFFLYCISIISMYNNSSFEISHFFSSFMFILLLLLIAFIFVAYLSSVSSKLFHRVVNIIFKIFSIDIIFTLFNKNLLNNVETIFFKEPSHLALAFLPFFLYKTIINYKIGNSNIMLFVFMIIMSVLIQNLTLLVGVLIAIIISSKLKTVISVFLLLSLVVSFLNIDYFISRLILTGDSDNLSVLVFLSGWERVIINMQNTYGLGIGLNQLGYIGKSGFLQEKIYMLMNSNLNYYDGGSTSTKILSELGVLGLFFLLAYIATLIKYIFLIKKYIFYFDSKDVLFFSFFIMFSVELYIRGMGYFTTGVMFFITSVFYINKISIKKIKLKSEYEGNINEEKNHSNISN